METIPILGKAYKVSLDLTLFAGRKSWANILHLTRGNDASTYGDRVPAIWTKPDDTKLHITSAVNGNRNYIFDTKDMPVNQKIHIEIEQKYITDGKYQYSINIDGEQVHTVENTKPETFEKVKVYIADPWYEAANGRVENVRITSKGRNSV